MLSEQEIEELSYLFNISKSAIRSTDIIFCNFLEDRPFNPYPILLYYKNDKLFIIESFGPGDFGRWNPREVKSLKTLEVISEKTWYKDSEIFNKILNILKGEKEEDLIIYLLDNSEEIRYLAEKRLEKIESYQKIQLNS